MAPTKSASRPIKRAPAAVVADPVDDVDEPTTVRAPRIGERVLVAVHPDKHQGRDDVAPADVTRVLQDDDGAYTVNLRVHYDNAIATGFLAGVPWYPDRDAFDEAEADAYLLLPGHRLKNGRVDKPGENHITQAPWELHDVRHWQTGAWPIDAGE